MAQLRKICHLTHPYPSERRWICAYALIRITLGTRLPGDPALATLYSSTFTQSSGFLIGNGLWRSQCSVPSLWQWKTEWKHYADCDISFKWWVLLFPVSLSHMEITRPSYTIPSVPNPFWRRNITRFFTTPTVKLLQWIKCLQYMFEARTTLLI